MKIGVLKEVKKGEKRVAIPPKIVKLLLDKKMDCLIEDNAGFAAHFTNAAYQEAGAVIKKRNEVFKEADVIIQINPFEKETIGNLQKGQITISLLYHLSDPELIQELAKKGITAFSLDAIPRISRAQDMDVLSSQNNLAGYKSVITGAYELSKIFPLMMTAAGTVTPSRVLIFGVGVAGLQAIATAKRLGAVVEATDIRPETKEQTESLGAKFITVEEDNANEEKTVYAKEASEEYRQKQKEAVEASLFKADLVITTAQVPGKKAPVLISKEQVERMQTGAVIVDLAAEQGGNCEYSEPDKTVIVNGVKIIGTSMAPVSVATNASELFGKNIYNFISHLTDENGFKWDLEEEITNATLIIKDGKIREITKI
jgi:NAD(P) transhydrogenase subunit alpha